MPICNYNNFKRGLFKRRKKIAKTLSWRVIATCTTFAVSYMIIGDMSKSGQVAAIDTVLKTIFYYFHEGCYDKATKKRLYLCNDDLQFDSENDLENSYLDNEDYDDNQENNTENNTENNGVTIRNPSVCQVSNI